MNMKLRPAGILVFITSLVISASGAYAAENSQIPRTVYTSGGVVKFVPPAISAEALADILFAGPVAKKELTRSIFDKKTRSAVSVAMLIQFEFDSAVLTDESKERLDAVGNMLKLDISNERGLVVEGHTDNIGQKDYNLKLSFKRAESVKRYLMLNHEADSNRLIINGKGESELLDPGSPADPVNRRVQFTAV